MSNNTQSAIIIVRPATTGLHLIEEVKKLSHKVIIICPSNMGNWNKIKLEIEPSIEILQSFGETILFEEEAPNILKTLKSSKILSSFNIIGAIPGFELGVELAEELAENLNLPVNEPRYRKPRRNKEEMKKVARQAGLKTASFKRCAKEEDITEFISNNGLPIVIKTPEGVGSSFVFVCKTANEARNNFKKIINSYEDNKNAVILAESYIEGPEFVVNMFSQNGTTIVTDIWAYQKLDNAFAQNIYESVDPLDLDDERYQELQSYGIALNKALGITVGPSHAEIKLTNDGPVMIEIGARLSGCHLPILMKNFSNFDPIKETVNAFVDKKVIFPKKIEQFKKSMVVYCRSSVSGILNKITNLDLVKKLNSYHSSDQRTIGTRITKTTNLFEFPLVVYLASSSIKDLYEDKKFILDKVEFETKEDTANQNRKAI